MNINLESLASSAIGAVVGGVATAFVMYAINTERVKNGRPPV